MRGVEKREQARGKRAGSRKERSSELSVELKSRVELEEESKVKESALDEPSAGVRKESRLKEREVV